MRKLALSVYLGFLLTFATKLIHSRTEPYSFSQMASSRNISSRTKRTAPPRYEDFLRARQTRNLTGC